jgi:hypothetical protein
LVIAPPADHIDGNQRCDERRVLAVLGSEVVAERDDPRIGDNFIGDRGAERFELRGRRVPCEDNSSFISGC